MLTQLRNLFMQKKKLNPTFTRVIGNVVQEGPGHLRGILAQFNTGPDLQEQVNTNQQSVPNVKQTCQQNKTKTNSFSKIFFSK